MSVSNRVQVFLKLYVKPIPTCKLPGDQSATYKVESEILYEQGDENEEPPEKRHINKGVLVLACKREEKH